MIVRGVPSKDERPLLVIDGDNLAHRAYHSMPKSLKSSDGRPINAIVGWTNMLLTIWDNEQPRSMFVAWDTLGVDTYRHKLWPTYQGGRVFDDAIVKQLNLLPSLAAAFGFGVGKQAGYEADDFMAAAAQDRRSPSVPWRTPPSTSRTNVVNPVHWWRAVVR